MKAPTLAVVTLHANGGGVAAVGNLLWRVFQREWGADARLVALRDDRPIVAEKASFALDVVTAQATRRTDWILFSHMGLAQVQRIVPRSLTCGYGVFLHGIEAWNTLSRAERRVLAHADVRVANSCFTAARVMAAHPDIGPVAACPLGLPEATHLQPSASAAVPDIGPAAVLVVGRMLASERYKGHDQLIEAWPRVVARVPQAVLAIAGTGDDEERLRRRAAASGVGRSIVFTGFVDRAVLHELYERAALFALPSRGEGFGLVYLEAMAHRLACVGSIHDAATEVIVNGLTGRLVDQGDIGEIAEALTGLLLDDAKRRGMGAAGFARLNREFTSDVFARRLLRILHEGQEQPALIQTAS
jgi:phosphatidylinositol alpha-1,6-mannosyltransferase